MCHDEKRENRGHRRCKPVDYSIFNLESVAGVTMRMLFTLMVAISLCGCSREARLYPANPDAGAGLLKARFTDSGMGKGPIEITMPDGEVLKGEFSTTDTSSYGFGTAIASSARAGPIIATGSSTAVAGSMPGVVTAIGPNGTSIRCEYQVNTFSGSGTGSCQTNRGAMYDIHF